MVLNINIQIMPDTEIIDTDVQNIAINKPANPKIGNMLFCRDGKDNQKNKHRAKIQLDKCYTAEICKADLKYREKTAPYVSLDLKLDLKTNPRTFATLSYCLGLSKNAINYNQEKGCTPMLAAWFTILNLVGKKYRSNQKRQCAEFLQEVADRVKTISTLKEVKAGQEKKGESVEDVDKRIKEANEWINKNLLDYFNKKESLKVQCYYYYTTGKTAYRWYNNSEGKPRKDKSKQVDFVKVQPYRFYKKNTVWNPEIVQQAILQSIDTFKRFEAEGQPLYKADDYARKIPVDIPAVKSSLRYLMEHFEDNRKKVVVKKIPSVDEFLSEFLNDKNILDKSLFSAYNSAMDNIDFGESNKKPCDFIEALVNHETFKSEDDFRKATYLIDGYTSMLNVGTARTVNDLWSVEIFKSKCNQALQKFKLSEKELGKLQNKIFSAINNLNANVVNAVKEYLPAKFNVERPKKFTRFACELPKHILKLLPEDLKCFKTVDDFYKAVDLLPQYEVFSLFKKGSGLFDQWLYYTSNLLGFTIAVPAYFGEMAIKNGLAKKYRLYFKDYQLDFKQITKVFTEFKKLTIGRKVRAYTTDFKYKGQKVELSISNVGIRIKCPKLGFNGTERLSYASLEWLFNEVILPAIVGAINKVKDLNILSK